MNLQLIRQACYALGLEEPISIEPDGTVWTGPDDDRVYPDMAPILKKVDTIVKDRAKALKAVRDKLSALGLTDADIDLLLKS